MSVTTLVADVATAQGFVHESFFYQDEASFVAGVVDFVRAGLEADEAVVVFEPAPRLDLLRESLGEDARAVELFDMSEVGINPARLIPMWTSAVEQHVRAGRTLRGVGEPAFVGRREPELVECRLHETLLNHAFGGGPAWRLLCLYDETNLPGQVCADALATHALWSTPTDHGASEVFDDALFLDAFAAPLPAPPADATRTTYGPGDLAGVRIHVAQFAIACGLAPARTQELILTASELASNSIRYGGGTGTLTLWSDRAGVVVEFADAGYIADPLLGRRFPALAKAGGRGLYLVNQLCDLVQLRSSPRGTTTRVTTWL